MRSIQKNHKIDFIPVQISDFIESNFRPNLVNFALYTVYIFETIDVFSRYTS